MNDNRIDDPASFFDALGGMHDADIEQIAWDALARTVTLFDDDLNSNFVGLPEYAGLVKAKFKFEDVEHLLLSCEANKEDVQRVYTLEVLSTQDSQAYEAVLRFSPGGRLNFTFCAVQ